MPSIHFQNGNELIVSLSLLHFNDLLCVTNSHTHTQNHFTTQFFTVLRFIDRAVLHRSQWCFLFCFLYFHKKTSHANANRFNSYRPSKVPSKEIELKQIERVCRNSILFNTHTHTQTPHTCTSYSRHTS